MIVIVGERYARQTGSAVYGKRAATDNGKVLISQ